MNFVVKMFNAIGRVLEFALTGQSEFRLTTSDFSTADTITNSVQAKIALKEVREVLYNRFGMMIINPVIINIDKPKTAHWKEAFTANRNHLGNYTTRWLGDSGMSHEISLQPGLERRKFKAVLAHELTHAYQAENCILSQHGGLREGMSRWVEYHTLRDMGLKKEAQKLCGYRSFLMGRAMVRILDYEQKCGRIATMKWLSEME